MHRRCWSNSRRVYELICTYCCQHLCGVTRAGRSSWQLDARTHARALLRWCIVVSHRPTPPTTTITTVAEFRSRVVAVRALFHYVHATSGSIKRTWCPSVCLSVCLSQDHNSRYRCCYYKPLIGSNLWSIELRHFPMTLNDLEYHARIQAYSNDIFVHLYNSLQYFN